MQDIIFTFLQLFQPITMAVTFVYFYSIMIRARRGYDRRWIALVIGALFGLAAIVSMTDPVEIAPGIIVDARNLFIGAAFGLFGFTAGTVTLAISIAMRAFTGGAGMWIGISAMLVSSVFATGWRFFVARRGLNPIAAHLGLGCMISAQIVVGLWLPQGPRAVYFNDMVPYVITMYLIGSLMLGLLVSREHVFQEEARGLKAAADTDALTGLLNRRSALVAVSRLLRDAQPTQGRAVIVLDIDHFKTINDTLGHGSGDQVLAVMTQRIRHCLRPDDVFARMGGDEFTIFLPNTSEPEAVAVATRCRKAVGDTPILIDGQNVTVTISLGVSWVRGCHTFDDQIGMADDALYRAKHRGRNKVSLWRKVDRDGPVKTLAA